MECDHLAILRNSAHCDECDTEIVSTHRHDWVSCTCGAIFVDGGRSYLRRGWTEGKSWADTSELTDKPRDLDDRYVKGNS